MAHFMLNIGLQSFSNTKDGVECKLSYLPNKVDQSAEFALSEQQSTGKMDGALPETKKTSITLKITPYEMYLLGDELKEHAQKAGFKPKLDSGPDPY